MSKRELPSLADAAWLREPRLQTVLSVLNAVGETRIAGGAVRNALFGLPVADVDLATVLKPQDVMRIAKSHHLGVYPTGLDHGTVTLTHEDAAFEVTTLRKDVETDGRHAVVSFSSDWREDAERRDFTFNAMYCDVDGKIYDFTNGYDDIQKRKVRFVGRPSARIKEDYLRILRFFRFHAHYGKGAPDTEGLKACARLKSGLKSLSVERIRQEMMKLLVATAPSTTLKLMTKTGILKTILPHTDEWQVIDRLPADALLRLYVLAKDVAGLKDRWRLSNAEGVRLQKLQEAADVSPALTELERRRLIYHLGAGTWRDAVLIAQSRAPRKQGWTKLLQLPDVWQVPVMPVKGSDILAAGVSAGPHVGEILALLEDWWVASDFAPTRDDLLARIGRYKT